MKGTSYGDVALIVNSAHFIIQKVDAFVPRNLEVIWRLLKPRNPSSNFKKIIVGSFYSPPDKSKNTKLADYLVSTLHHLITTYPESGIILGADRNGMNIAPLLSCGLKLRQIVDLPTRG